jgi:sulfur-oxidizing protein SoxX
MRRAHLRRYGVPRQPAQRGSLTLAGTSVSARLASGCGSPVLSTPRRLPSGAASQLDPSHRSSRHFSGTLLAAAILAACCLVGVAHANDAIPASLTGAKGDPARGRAIVANRQVGLCLLCHSGPFPEERFQGNLAPDLRGAGQRWSEGQLRLRIVDSGRINPATIMPAYHRTDGLVRVAPAWRGKPVLSAEQIEDVVAFLMTLRD